MPSLEQELRQLSTGWEYVTCESGQFFSLQFRREGLKAIARITENYPRDPANIDLEGSEWETMPEEMQKKFIEAINEFTKVCRGQAMLNKILEKAWNITRVDSSGTPVAQIECAKLNQQAKKSKKKKKNRIVFQIGLAPNFSATASIKNPEKEKIQKSCSMKSAKDVISRLRQDEQLENEDFLMRYEDRSQRKYEVPISAVKWEDDGITNSTNSQPILEFLIQQFTWNSRIVWDKSTNTDYVFGSGSIGFEDDLVKFIRRHKAQSQFESFKIRCSSLETEANNLKQQTSVIEERPKSGNCLLNSLNKGGNTINTVAESSLNKEDGNENLIESNGNGSDLRMKIEPTVLDNNSMLNLPGDGTVDKLKPDGVIDSEESMSNSHCGEIDGEKSNKNIEKDSYSTELGESCMSGKYETGHHHAIGEHENEMSLPSHRDNNVQSSENLEMVLKKVLSESEVGNLEQSDGTSIDDNTGYKETEQDVIEDNPLSAVLSSSEEREDASDKITCPKDVKDRKDRKHQYYQPYKKPHNKKIHDKRSERRDQEIFEKRHGFHHESDKRSSEDTPHTYRYCIAVDVGRNEEKELRKLQRQIMPSHKSKMKFRSEGYLFINVADVSFDNMEDRRAVQELLKQVCKDLKAFRAWMHEVKPQGRMIVATFVEEAFQHFSKKLLEQTPSNVNITCNPYVPLFQIHGDSHGIENRKFPRPRLKCFIKSMYLWNLEEGDDQPFDCIDLELDAAHSHEEQYQRSYGPNSRPGDLKNSKWEFIVSKKLVSVLRHNDLKFTVDDEGYLHVNSLLQHQFFKRLHVTESDIEKIVETNAKKRFALKGTPGNYQIRATQGHTVKNVDLNLRAIEDPDEFPNVIHGTMHKYYQSIIHEGLSRMKRNHIHMTTGLPRDESHVISGMRNSSDCFIYVDVRKAMNDGIEFFVSDNGVILSEGIDGTLQPKYFKKVVHRIDGQDRELPSWDQDKPMSTNRGSEL